MSNRDKVHPVRRPSMDSLFRNSIRRKKKVKFDLATVSFQVDYPTKPKRKAWVEVIPENVTWCDEVWARLANSNSTQPNSNEAENSEKDEDIKPKENLMIYCMKQLSFSQWMKFLLSILCFVQFLFAVWRIFTLFQK